MINHLYYKVIIMKKFLCLMMDRQRGNVRILLEVPEIYPSYLMSTFYGTKYFLDMTKKSTSRLNPLATVNTLLWGGIYEPDRYISMHIEQKKHFFKICINSETNAQIIQKF